MTLKRRKIYCLPLLLFFMWQHHVYASGFSSLPENPRTYHWKVQMAEQEENGWKSVPPVIKKEEKYVNGREEGTNSEQTDIEQTIKNRPDSFQKNKNNINFLLR